MSDANSEQCGEEPSIISGSLTLGLLLSVVTSVILIKSGRVGWSWGFSVGAGISLISLYSLSTLVPRLTMPAASGASQFLLALVLFLKLPLYTIALYAVTRMPGVDARSAFPGILVAPIAITAKAVGAGVWHSIAEAAYRRRIRRGGSVIMQRRQGRAAWRRRPQLTEPASEQS